MFPIRELARYGSIGLPIFFSCSELVFIYSISTSSYTEYDQNTSYELNIDAVS